MAHRGDAPAPMCPFCWGFSMDDDTNFAEWAGALLEWNSELRKVRFQCLGCLETPWLHWREKKHLVGVYYGSFICMFFLIVAKIMKVISWKLHICGWISEISCNKIPLIHGPMVWSSFLHLLWLNPCEIILLSKGITRWSKYSWNGYPKAQLAKCPTILHQV